MTSKIKLIILIALIIFLGGFVYFLAIKPPAAEEFFENALESLTAPAGLENDKVPENVIWRLYVNHF